MKGQSSMEFLAYVSLSMLILAALYTVMVDKQKDTFNERNVDVAQAAADKAAFNVEMALVQGEGYSRVFTLPSTIGGDNYTMFAQNGTVKVDWGENSILRSTRYNGAFDVQIDDSNVLKVTHNSSGVFLIEQ